MNEEQLCALLRIKRFEQPPPQNTSDRLLQDIHRRQRTELLRRPLWKIAAERAQTFFSEHSMGHLSYAGALAAVLVVGVTTIGLVTSGGGTTSSVLAVHPANRDSRVADGSLPVADKLLTLQASTSRPVLESPSLLDLQQGYEDRGSPTALHSRRAPGEL